MKVRTVNSISEVAYPWFTIHLDWKAVMIMVLTYTFNDKAVQLCIIQDVTVPWNISPAVDFYQCI